MIEIKNLVVNYKNKQSVVQALGPINMHIKEGEIIALIGSSGCGKSTLLHVLGGIIRSYEGSVCLEGKAIDYKKQAIGYMPQGYGLLPWKSVYGNCILPYKIKGIKETKELKGQIEEVLKTLGLGDLTKRYPQTLSGGQKQRVALARAFAFTPSLLLMDEPFSALDARMKEEAEEMFLRLWEKHHCTSVLVTHSIEEAIYIGTKIIVLSHTPGRIAKVMSNPLFAKKDVQEQTTFKDLYKQIKKSIRVGEEA